MKLGLIILVALTLIGCGGPRGSELPDLAFWADCPIPFDDGREKSIENFLERAGYRTINLGRIQRQHGRQFHALSITALDARKRTLSLIAFRDDPKSISVGLYSLPPTVHDAQHEKALIDFMQSGLGCTVSQVSRNDNGTSALEMHLWNVKRIEGLFKEAEELKSKDDSR